MEDVQVIEINDEDLDSLMGVAPEKTFKAEDLESAQKKEEKKEEPKSSKESPKPKEKTNISETEEETQEVTEISETDEDELFNQKEEEEESQNQPKKVSKQEKAEEAKTVNFKNLVDHFVESGKWVEFEGREDIDQIAEEDFIKIAEQQDEFRVNSKFKDVLDSTGDYGKAIIQFEKDGGNPAQMLELFREQRDIQNVDLTNEDNQEEVIRAYYEAQGEDSKWIDRYITRLKDDGEDVFKEDAESKHAKLLENNKAEVENLKSQQKAYKEEQEEIQKTFHSNTRKAIHSVEDWSNPEKKDLEKFILSYDKKLKDGRVVNGLFLKMTEIQQDPAKYIKFAKFIQDMDKYEETVKKKAATETVKKTWKIIHDSEGEGYKKASQMPDQINAKKKDPFSLTFKT